MMASLCRQNYDEASEAYINMQINKELHASYVYQAMAFHFDRDDVALPGFHKFFSKMSEEEREHAEKFMKYQNKRGGRIKLNPIENCAKDEWASGLDALRDSLLLEKEVNASLLHLHEIATSKNDPQLCDFVEEFLEEQVGSMKELNDLITRAVRAGPGLGEHIFDKDLH